MSKFLLVANWKMNPASIKEAKDLFTSVKRGLKKLRPKRVEVVICPPFVYLSNFKFQISNFKLGSQDCFWQEKGAFTGEIAPSQLLDLGCQYVILGHSERRRYLGETDEIVNKKIKAVIGAGLFPILCIGENLEQRRRGETKRVLEHQLTFGLRGISQFMIRNSQLGIAYEPIWAISTSKNRKDCPAQEIHIMSLLIRKILIKKYKNQGADKIRILFGGNVNSENARIYCKEAKVQGFLVGSASLNPQEFLKIIKIIEGLKPDVNPFL